MTHIQMLVSKAEGYNIIRRDRESHAGAVCAYIREDLSYNIRSDLNNPDLEDLWFEIRLKKSKPLFTGVCCRTNNNTKCFECLESTLSKLRSDCNFVVLEDFNVFLIKIFYIVFLVKIVLPFFFNLT